MLRRGRTVLLEGQTEHVDVGVLSTLGMLEWSKFPALQPRCLGFLRDLGAGPYHVSCLSKSAVYVTQAHDA